MKGKYIYLFFMGSTVYPAIEIIFRGNTHYSMAAAGGVCVCLIDKICNGLLKSKNFFIKCISGGIIITVVEFVFGVIFNLALEMNVWNYSNLPLNIFGQICLPFTFIWAAISAPIMYFGKLFETRK